jgi:hypothetical protein
MKTKGIILITALVLLCIAVAPSMAVKPADNHAGAQKYSWHLSGDVMPVPPYGSQDIPGSDTASKLIVNQPNGKIVVMINGVMNGLDPNTTYTVYLSNGYIPQTDWPGLFDAATVPAFTFTTNATGSGTWHLNLQADDFPGTGTYPLSIWIDTAGKTLLISDNFDVVIT